LSRALACCLKPKTKWVCLCVLREFKQLNVWDSVFGAKGVIPWKKNLFGIDLDQALHENVYFIMWFKLF
jgi:hypothetical protein